MCPSVMEESRSESGSLIFETSQNLSCDLKLFISTYKRCPALWDPDDTNYMNKFAKIENLNKLKQVYKNIKPNATIDDVRKKINSLRSNYRKELRRIMESKQPGNESGSVYRPTSATYYMLQFLSKIEKNLVTKDDHDKTISVNQSPPPKKIKTTRIEHLRRTSPILTQPPEYAHKSAHPLALVWTEKLELLDPTQKLFAEKAINDILFEAQLNNLHKRSVQINSLVSTGGSPYPYIPSPLLHSSENSNSVLSEDTFKPEVDIDFDTLKKEI